MGVNGILGIKLGMTQIFAEDGIARNSLHGAAGGPVRGGAAPNEG